MISLEDVVFGGCGVVGAVLAVMTVAFEERLADWLDAGLDRDRPMAGVIARVAVSLVGFGLVGLLATRLLGIHGGFAVAAALAGAVVGATVGPPLLAMARGSGGIAALSMRDLVGRTASVAVAIPGGKFGSVYVRSGGRSHEYSATAAADIPAGVDVTVTGAVGDGLIVAPVAAPVTRSLLDGDDTGA
jgi:membrane protein implicated in regulation of membrane protease activity